MSHRNSDKVKILLFVMILINISLSFSLVKAQTDLIVFNSDIDLVKFSEDGKIKGILTKNQQILVYNDMGMLIDRIVTCPALTLTINVVQQGNSQNHNRIYSIQTTCKNGNTKIHPLPNPTSEPTPNSGEKYEKSRILLSSNNTCGDGNASASQQCDDGNTISGDGCSSDCKMEVCGDLIINGKEECDDGNTVGGDGCSSTCMNQCGNGIVQGSQQCDDGNRENGDGCTSTCQFEQTSTVLPLAVGIPLGVLALAGVGGAIFSIVKGSAGAAAGAQYISNDPVRAIQVEQSTKMVRGDSIL